MFSIKIWKEYLFQRYVIDFMTYPMIVMFGVVAARLDNFMPIILAAIVNYVMMVFSFMYNDIADRIEDAKSPGKRFKNPFGYKVWSLGYGYFLLGLMTIFSLAVSYYLHGWILVIVAVVNLAIGFLYSSNFVRLKGMPVIDLLSHGLLLAGIQVIYFVLLPGAHLDIWALLIVGGTILFSMGGDLDNEYRDFEDDRMAGLRNSASFIGKDMTVKLSRTAWVVAGIFLVIGVIGAIASLVA